MTGRVSARASVATLALLGLFLTGCTELDPLTQESVWHSQDVNAANLRAMVAVPGDLAYGVAALSSDGHRAMRAMERLRTDRVYPLPESGISKIGAGQSAAPVPVAE